MGAPLQIEVDLSDPVRLERIERDYLQVSVCPVSGKASPGLLVPVTVVLKLPGDVQVASSGKVIQETGPRSFLVQLDSPPDLERLKRIAEEPPKVPRAPLPHERRGAPVRPVTAGATSGTRPTGGHARPAKAPLPDLPGAEASRLLSALQDREPPAVVARETEKKAGAPAVKAPVIALVDTLVDPDLDPALVGTSRESPPEPAEVADPFGPVEDPVAGAGPQDWTPDLDRLLEARGRVAGGRDGKTEETPAEVTGNETESSDVYARIKNLTLSQKQRLARHGRRPVRNLLIRDPNKNLHRLVVANPDVGVDEITEYSAYPALSKDAIEFIAQNRTWMASRQIVFNLVRNPATPIDLAVRLVPRLGSNEWRWLARPGAVRMPVAAAARKQIVENSA